MTITERNDKLKHFIACLKCEVSGKCCDNDCPTQYDAGNMGEIIENLEAISKALEQEPCEDAISRKAVLDKLNRLIEVEQLQGTDEMGYGRERVSAYECMIEDVESEYLYPNIQLNEDDGWIPVSERMPEEYADVICCTNKGEVFMATYLGKMNDGVNCFDDDNGMMWEGNVIAWMPLPRAYKAESEDNADVI